ncbi:MAG: thiamine pyrophosphate-dependent dehydrogenase E1 component subunit alpha [Pseudomonadota bacterium]
MADKDVLLDIFTRADLIMQSDRRFRKMIGAGQLQIVYYPVRGQEVVSAAMMAAINQDDYLVTIYRGLHDQLAKGIPSKDLWAEFAGKVTGTCKGKGGPMHITHPETGVMVTTGIVGSGIPIANGLGLASQLEKDNKVTVCCFGDGASNIGAFHEGLNMAQIWDLPVIFLCQNNHYGEHTHMRDTTGSETIKQRGEGLGMRSVRVNGNDASEMYAAAKEAVDHARAGNGPTLIEAMTFRFHGHLLGDTSHYIPKEEMEQAKKDDPMPILRQQLLDIQVSEADIAAIEAKNTATIDEAAQFALDSDYPSGDEYRIDVLDVEIAA